MLVEIGKSQAKAIAEYIHGDIVDYIVTHKEEFENYKKDENPKSKQQEKNSNGGGNIKKKIKPK